jgi:hypothetical protein
MELSSNIEPQSIIRVFIVRVTIVFTRVLIIKTGQYHYSRFMMETALEDSQQCHGMTEEKVTKKCAMTKHFFLISQALAFSPQPILEQISSAVWIMALPLVEVKAWNYQLLMIHL